MKLVIDINDRTYEMIKDRLFFAGGVRGSTMKYNALTAIYNGKPLEQEPCEDCISREHLLEEIASLKESPWFKDDTNCAMAIRKEAIEIVEDLCIRKEPSVNPQESCEDAVSRKAVKEQMIYYGFHAPDMTVTEFVEDCLPSVNPQESKTGHWEQYGNFWEDKFKCSECGKEQPKILCGEQIIGHWSDYCPNCGAKMVES